MILKMKKKIKVKTLYLLNNSIHQKYLIQKKNKINNFRKFKIKMKKNKK